MCATVAGFPRIYDWIQRFEWRCLIKHHRLDRAGKFHLRDAG
jgi:hypothetical protein